MPNGWEKGIKTVWDLGAAYMGLSFEKTVDEIEDRMPFEDLEEVANNFIDWIKDHLDIGAFVEQVGDETWDFISGDAKPFLEKLWQKTIGFFTEDALGLESIGAETFGPVLERFERYAAYKTDEPKAMLNAFMGFLTYMTLPKFVFKLIENNISSTILGPVSEFFDGLYWTWGLGFLGWMGLSPLMTHGLGTRLNEYYAALFASARYSEDELIRAYYKGELSTEHWKAEMRKLGWAEGLVDNRLRMWINPLSRVDCVRLVEHGHLKPEQAIEHYIQQGIDGYYARKLFDIDYEDYTDDSVVISSSRLRKWYTDGYLTQDEFREHMRKAGFTEQQINDEIGYIAFIDAVKRRELSVGQLKAAFKVGKITEVEAGQALTDIGYNMIAVGRLLGTWKAELAPKIVRVNAGTIIRWLRKGVIDHNEALQRLLEAGHPLENAQNYIQEAFIGTGTAMHQVPISTLMRAVENKSITLVDFTNRLLLRQVPKEDIHIYVDLIEMPEPPPLSLSDIKDAFLYRVINDAQAVQFQVQLDETPQNAGIRLQTWVEQRKERDYTLGVGTWLRFYTQKIVTRDQAFNAIVAIGPNPHETNMLLQLADREAMEPLTRNEIKLLFGTGTVDNAGAQYLLKMTGLTHDEANALVTAWARLYQLPEAMPSLDVIMEAFEVGFIDTEGLFRKLRAQGYTDETIHLFISLAGREKPAKEKELTKTDIIRGVKRGVKSYTWGLEELVEIGYSIDKAEYLLDIERPDISDTQVHKLFMAGYIAGEEYLDVLHMLGYKNDEIEPYLDELLSGL